MGKFFEMIGTLMATACLIQIAADPASALRDIKRGPMPELARFNAKLYEGKMRNYGTTTRRDKTGSCRLSSAPDMRH